MSDYDESDKGVLFKNDKRGNDKAPDYRGKGNYGGKDFDISAWINESKSGMKYMALKLQKPYQASEPVSEQPIAEEQTEDEIPF